MNEQFVLVDNLFYISNYGRVKKLNGDIVDFSNRKSRYIAYKKYPIHRLVAEIFIPNLDNKPEVNHIDGNKHNNRYDNLEWVTTSENRLHAYKTGLQTPTYGFKGKHHSQKSKENIGKHGWLKGTHTKPKNFVHNTPHSEDTKVKISIANSNKHNSLRNEVV